MDGNPGEETLRRRLSCWVAHRFLLWGGMKGHSINKHSRLLIYGIGSVRAEEEAHELPSIFAAIQTNQQKSAEGYLCFSAKARGAVKRRGSLSVLRRARRDLHRGATG